MTKYFNINEKPFKADAVVAIVQRDTGVEVRYSDGSRKVFIPDTTVMSVTDAIDQVKS